MKILTVLIIVMALATSGAARSAGIPSPVRPSKLTALQYQEAQINTLKGQVAVLQSTLKCFSYEANVAVRTIDGVAYIVEVDASDPTHISIPTLLKRCQ